VFGRDDEGVEAWEFSTPSVVDGRGERIPFDERPTVEIQMEIDGLLKGDRRERGVWVVLVVALISLLMMLPGDIVLTGLGLVAAGITATTIGLLRVRRRQLRDALEGEVAERRREELADATERGHRLAVLHDALDRSENHPRRRVEIVVGFGATLLFGGFGLVEAQQLGVVLGAFFGVLTAVAVRDEWRRLLDEAAMREEIRAIEEGRALPADE